MAERVRKGAGKIKGYCRESQERRWKNKRQKKDKEPRECKALISLLFFRKSDNIVFGNKYSIPQLQLLLVKK